MPELPEVETMIRGLRDHVHAANFVSLVEMKCQCAPLKHEPAWSEMNERLSQIKLLELKRRGKRILFCYEDGQMITLEPRMTGLIALDEVPDQTHTRLEFTHKRGKKLIKFWYWDRRGLGVIKLLDKKEADEFLQSDHLGIDALEMRDTDWVKVCHSSNRPIKNILLDQQKVAGIGNLYASEILHAAGIHPERPAKNLNLEEIEQLSASTRQILLLAIEYEGSTLSDGTYRNALNKSGRYQNEHQVYMKHQQPCSKCVSSTIERIVQAQRSTFYCPKCQK
jgi:formamidopyrimidine-DNA glycosylase